MNIPKEAIEKAIEGGWAEVRLKELPNWNVGSRTAIAFWKELPLAGSHKSFPRKQYLQMSSIALDPLFWQALIPERHDFTNLTKNEDTWYTVAIRFYSLILQGTDTTEFWKELLTNK
jgi:hypothetical protein